jgi:hypothetical protein
VTATTGSGCEHLNISHAALAARVEALNRACGSSPRDDRLARHPVRAPAG